MALANFSKRINLKLLFLVLFQGVFFVVYQYINNAYQTWDSAGHIALSFRMANEIKGIYDQTAGYSLINLLKISNYYPPLIQLLGAVFSLIFGYSSEFILVIILAFFVAAIITVYKLALLLSKSKDVAFYTALLFSFFPQVLEQSRIFHLDLPLVTLILLALYFLLTSNSLSNFRNTFLFFVFAALAQLTKWYGFIYLLIPFIIVFFLAWQKIRKGLLSRKRIVINLFPGIFTAFVICTPWYYVNYTDLLKFSKIFSIGERDDPVGLFSLDNLLFYPITTLSYQTLFLPFLCIILGLVVLFRKNRPQFLYLSAYLFLSPLVFLFISNKNLRYILPLTPLFAYIIAYFCASLPKKLQWFKYVVVGYLVSGALFLTFNHMTAREKFLLPISYFFVGPTYHAWYVVDPVFYAYDSNYYPIGQVLDDIYKDANKFGRNPLGIANLSDSQKFSAATLEMLRLEKHMNNVYLPVPYFQFVPFNSDAEMDAFLTNNGAEYVIAPSYVGPQGLRNYAALAQMAEYLNSGRNVYYTKFKAYDFPNGIVVNVFKRIGIEQKFVMPGECTDKAGFLDGIETIQLVPNTTYVLFTGHFALQEKIVRNYEQGVLYIVQIENEQHTSYLDIHNLPRNGSALCARVGRGLDTMDEIRLPLTQENRCGDGVNCQKVVLVRWTVGDATPSITEYNREDFVN